MPARNPSLHGFAPDQCPVALLLIDVINGFDFPDGDKLLALARPAAEQIASLRERASAHNVPVVYVNDNVGRWRDDFEAVVRHHLRPEAPGRDVAERLRPSADDYAVLKAKHSAFFQTALDPLLAHLGTRTLVLAGFSSDVCVLATALDATMRDFQVVVPADASAAVEATYTETALAYLRRVADARTPAAADVDFAALIAEARTPEPTTT